MSHKDSLRPIKAGVLDQSLDLGGFVVTQTVRQPGLVLPPHYHAHTNIALSLRGVSIETVAGRPYDVGPGSLILRPAGEMHANRFGREEARCLIIEVLPRRLEMIRQTSDVLERESYHRSQAILLLTRRIQNELRFKDEASSLAIEALTLELLAQAVRRNFRRRQTIEYRGLREARDFIHERFADRISLSDIAQAAGMHPSHLAKMFRRHFHCTVGEYVRRLRLQSAEHDLSCSNKTLSEVALAAGFYDQSHFTHAFKLRWGLTPSAYRAAIHTGKAHTKRP
jgi:AraC-like DNA-binding protein/quercetin dioxygenase-like cupin family protein